MNCKCGLTTWLENGITLCWIKRTKLNKSFFSCRNFIEVYRFRHANVHYWFKQLLHLFIVYMKIDLCVIERAELYNTLSLM